MAQITNTSISMADAFLCTGSSNYQSGADLTGLNFGAAGALVVAPSSGAKGEFQSVIEFDTATGRDLFDSTYGSNGWAASALMLELTSNNGDAGEQPNNPLFPVVTGGKFVIEWLATNGWPEGTGTPNFPTTDGVSYDSLPDLLAGPHEILSTNTYTPPGDNAPVIYPIPLNTKVAREIAAGDRITFLLYAADGQIGYLFNSYKFGHGNEPKLHVVALPRAKIIYGVVTNGGFSLVATGGVNSTYNIQMATNLGAPDWVVVGTATADSGGAIRFDDTNSAAHAQSFYRLSQ